MSSFKIGDRVRVKATVINEDSVPGTMGTVLKEPYGPAAGGNVVVELGSGERQIWLGNNIECVDETTKVSEDAA